MNLKILKNPNEQKNNEFNRIVNECNHQINENKKNKEDFSQEIFEIICIEKTDFTKIRELAKKGVNLNSEDPLIEEFVPIIAAAQHNKIELLEELIDLGADVNKTDNEGRNCLMIMILNEIEQEKIIEIIEKTKKIDLNHKDKEGCSLLTYAIGNEKRKVIDKLLELNVEIMDVDYLFASTKYISNVIEKFEENQ